MSDETDSAPIAVGSYLLGTDPEEVRRPETQHRMWAATPLDLWDRARFGPGAHLLDLGFGRGFTTIELAGRVEVTGRVLAVDESARFIGTHDGDAKQLGLDQI